MKVKIEISRLAGKADSEHTENLIPLDPEGLPEDISPDRIRELALSKLRNQDFQGERKEEKGMRRISRKAIVIVAIVCTLSVTAFAAAGGGLDFFRAIFGDSIEHSAEHIRNVMQSEEAGDYRMTVESVLTDGFTANVIVSLEDVTGKALKLDEDLLYLFGVDFTRGGGEEGDGIDTYSCSWSELPGFGTSSKQYFDLEVSGVAAADRSQLSQLEITLSEEYAPISLKVDLVNYMAHLEVLQNEADFAEENLTVTSLQLSPMGALLHGKERVQQGGLEAPWVFIQFRDGTTEEIFSAMSFDSSDDGHTVMGGGGVVIGGEGQPEPLVTSTQGARNTDHSIVMRAGFGRIINLDEVVSVRINGVEYPVELR